MKRLLMILLLLITPTFVGAETMSEHIDNDYLGWAQIRYFNDKMDIRAAQSVCRRMLRLAEKKGITIVINSEFITEKDFKPTLNSCNTSSVDFAMFIALMSAQQLNVTAKPYSCNEWLKIKIINTNMSQYFSMYRASYDTDGRPDILCSDKEDYCVVNQKVKFNSGGNGLLTFCFRIENLKYHVADDGSCVTDDFSYISRLYEKFVSSPRALSDFDKDCKYLGAE